MPDILEPPPPSPAYRAAVEQAKKDRAAAELTLGICFGAIGLGALIFAFSAAGGCDPHSAQRRHVPRPPTTSR